jgi:hypothetical protein
VRYAPLIAAALVGWALAIFGIAELDAAVAFGGVAATTLALVLGFAKLERGAEERRTTTPPTSSGARRHRHAAP